MTLALCSAMGAWVMQNDPSDSEVKAGHDVTKYASTDQGLLSNR